MLFQVIYYIKFLVQSTNQHGVHSPFVYELITKCFYDSAPKPWYKIIKHYKKELLNNHTTITIQDFGAGSRTLQNNHRKIADIAKKAGISLQRAKLLGRIVSYCNANTMLEIGTSLGIATAASSFSQPKSNIITLEGCANTATIAKKAFEKYKLSNIEIVIGNFKETLPKVLKNNTFDLIYFDGNHQKNATIQYFEQCLPHTHNDTVFVFDDIYWSKGMREAWLYIKEHRAVTVSIDTFYWGIIFFRKEQPKQHFTIRT